MQEDENEAFREVALFISAANAGGLIWQLPTPAHSVFSLVVEPPQEIRPFSGWLWRLKLFYPPEAHKVAAKGEGITACSRYLNF
jgi:hypothetical protein